MPDAAAQRPAAQFTAITPQQEGLRGDAKEVVQRVNTTEGKYNSAVSTGRLVAKPGFKLRHQICEQETVNDGHYGKLQLLGGI